MDNERLDIEKTLKYLTLDEKLRMLSGDGMWHTFGAGELPRVRMSDGPNGLRMTGDGALAAAVPATCYPTLGMLACSWDPALLYSVGSCIGREATAMGVNLVLAPGLNIKRHPLGGRNFEYLSEDALLSGELGKAYVSGVQATGVGACVKHFAANNQEDKRMYSDSVIDERTLHELYLKPFEIALQAEPQAVMCAYNKLNGTLCAENKYLLTDVLRDEWNYDGVVISDWGAVRDRAMSLAAGLDLAMPDTHGIFEQSLSDALAAGDITEADVDRALRRLLGMIDNVYLEPYGDYDTDAHDKLSYNAAAASVVLLKNENKFLPLTRDMKITVCGELAETAPIQGYGSSHVAAIKSLSPLDAFSLRGIDVTYSRGYSKTAKDNDALIHDALAAAKNSDAVVVYVGAPTPAEGIDRTTLSLPPEQDKLIKSLTTAGRRVVVVVCSTGPVAMPWVNRVRGIVYAGLNGQNGATAAVDLLFGRINPHGKLAETFPADLDDIGTDFGGTRVLYREGPFVGYKYYDAIERRPLFPFGHGLSFCDVSYDSLTVKRVSGCEFDAVIRLTNNSVRDAYEIVQLYVTDNSGRVLRPVKQLAGYSKIFIEGETSTTVTIRLNRDAFEFYDVQSHSFKIPDGEYAIHLAASAADIRHSVTVKVDGDYFDYSHAPDVYNKPFRAKITDADFTALYGSELPEDAQPQRYSLGSCIADMQSTLVGKIARHSVMRRAKSVGEPNSPERAAFIENALNTPLVAVSAMSDGAMSLSAARGVVEMANGHFFKGLRLLLHKNK